MKKITLVLVMVFCTALLFSGGGGQQGGSSSGGSAPVETGEKVAITDAVLNQLGLVRSGNTYRFRETKSISIEVWDRGLDGGRSKAEDNYYVNWIKAGLLRDHNIAVTYKPVGRWTEIDELNNLLAASSAPDVCVTYDYATIQAYAGMGGVIDLNPLINRYADLFPNVWELLGDEFINYDKDPKTDQLWAIEGKISRSGIGTQVALVRQDWLKKLNISEPKNVEEFHRMLVAFRDNARTLLGNDANMMIPFLLTQDAAWYTRPLIVSFLPSALNDRDWFIYGFDDRHLGRPGSVRNEIAVKSAMRIMNQWYNENLVWKDYYLYPDGDPMQDNLLKAGYVGAYMQNWNYPYRDGRNGVTAMLHANVSPDADFIAMNPFPNDAGKPWGVGGPQVDRKVFFPNSNKEPIASLLYLDWIYRKDNLFFIQFGERGVTHEVLSNGAVRTLTVTGEKIMNSPNNIDYTYLINGIQLDTLELENRSLGLAYPEVDPAITEKALNASQENYVILGRPNVGPIASEEGMGQVLKEKRDAIYARAIQSPAAQFDSVFDAGYRDWLQSGGQAIIDERSAKWREYYGDKTSVR
jgi:putative aldouronate transport system substrate-binding protein